MSTEFTITPQKAAEVVKSMSTIIGCDYKTIWKYYIHDWIKENVMWKEVEEYL